MVISLNISALEIILLFFRGFCFDGVNLRVRAVGIPYEAFTIRVWKYCISSERVLSYLSNPTSSRQEGMTAVVKECFTQ